MLPEGTRVLRREQRHAWRGLTGKRRSTRKVKTTYGRLQRDRDWQESMRAAVAAFKAQQETGQ